MSNKREILSVTAEVTVYPGLFTGPWVFSIPRTILTAFDDPKVVYVVVRDVFGNPIHHRLVNVESGPEVKKENFETQIDSGQLYPRQRIRLEVSRP